MKLKYVIISIVILVISSCGSTKKVVDESPSWIKSRPLSSVDYIGIGKSSKIKSPYNYAKQAKNNALGDISSEISVNISSSSVLSSVETSHGFVETYSSLIKSNTQNEIEGYELISTYETETEYWCYYKLNKEKYDILREAKKQASIFKSLDFYKRSVESSHVGELKSSILLNIKAIESVKNYWSEDIKVKFEGKNVSLGNELISNLNKLFRSISIKPKSISINGVRGKSISKELLSFTLNNSDDVAQEGIPVLFFYSESRLANNKSFSNNLGKVSYGFNKLKSDSETAIVTCKVDVGAIIDEASIDYLLHRLLDKIYVSQSEINISVRNPIIHISSDERILGEKYNLGDLELVLTNYFDKKGITTSSIKQESDFQIIINADTKMVSKNSDRVYTSELFASIKMISDSEIVYSTTVNGFYGRGSDYKSASMDAYSKSHNYTEVKVGNQIYRCILD